MGRWILNIASFVAGFGLMVMLAYLIPARETPGVHQPLPFNHKKHVAAGWTCANCHPFVDQQAFAGLPRAQECVDCHESEMPKHPKNRKMREMTEQLRQLVAEGRDIPWQQVHRTAGHVYFSHRRHVEIAKLDCKDCHGQVDKMTEPFTKPAFPLPKFPKEFAYQETVRKMEWCLSCHTQKKVTTDCLACHR